MSLILSQTVEYYTFHCHGKRKLPRGLSRRGITWLPATTPVEKNRTHGYAMEHQECLNIPWWNAGYTSLGV